MVIHVVASWAGRYLSSEETHVEVPPNATAMDAITAAGIPTDEIGPIEREGRLVRQGDSLEEGDSLIVHPKIIDG